MKCSGNQRLYYDITGQGLEPPTTCNGASGICVDRLKLTFPGNGHCERCGDMSDAINGNCMDRSGLGKEMIVEFITNRVENSTGFEIIANCVNPAFGISNVPGAKREPEQCTSPTGMSPVILDPLPPVS